MTVEDLKNELFGKKYPEKVQIGPDQIVIDVDKFLRIQFIECDQWNKAIEKCPAYGRLMKFYETVKEENKL